MRLHRLIFLSLTLAGVACSNSTGLPVATVDNAERVDTLWALLGTPVATPSAYSLEGSRRVRTDLSVDFDFAYNLENGGRHVFIPRSALGIDTTNTANPGLLLRNDTFEAITLAPSNGFTTDQPVPINVGERYVVRSRITCSLGVPKYAKLEILTFDDTARIATFRILTDDNCGFKSLEPGLPAR